MHVSVSRESNSVLATEKWRFSLLLLCHVLLFLLPVSCGRETIDAVERTFTFVITLSIRVRVSSPVYE